MRQQIRVPLNLKYSFTCQVCPGLFSTDENSDARTVEPIQALTRAHAHAHAHTEAENERERETQRETDKKQTPEVEKLLQQPDAARLLEGRAAADVIDEMDRPHGLEEDPKDCFQGPWTSLSGFK